MNAARIAEGLRLLADAIEAQPSTPKYYDQATSPLGRRRHLELARHGAFPHVKDGRRVLVRVEDVQAFLDAKRVVRVTSRDDDDTEAERLVERMKRRG
jgi:hypothetical protein